MLSTRYDFSEIVGFGPARGLSRSVARSMNSVNRWLFPDESVKCSCRAGFFPVDHVTTISSFVVLSNVFLPERQYASSPSNRRQSF